MDDEILDVVDGTDRVIGRAVRSEAVRNGLLHRAVNVVLVSKGRVLLQQRSQGRKVLPGAWDVSASEHVRSGESYEAAAARGVREELGVAIELVRARDQHVQEAAEGALTEREMVVLFLGEHAGPFTVQKEEVAQVRWMTPAGIKTGIAQSTMWFTPWFLDEWKWLENRVR